MHLEKLTPRTGKSTTIRAVVETPGGSRNKYSYDPDERVFVLKKVLPEGHVFPFDFGFVPQTKAEDGDPMDVLVLMDEPGFPGVVVECRVIGVVQANQTKKGKTVRNDRFIAVAETSLNFRRVHDLRDLDRDLIAQLEYFFVSYIEGAGGQVRIVKTQGAAAARRLLKPMMRSNAV
jgi:inorganic pyrophosphatase